MKNLYIIGNGFDLYHGLDTKYQSFAKFLAKKYPSYYDDITKYLNLPDISKDSANDEEYAQWANFELSLADLDYEEVLSEFYDDDMPNPGSDDFSDGDWDTYRVRMEEIVEQLTITLISYFNEFILSVNYPDNIQDKKIILQSQSIFINFNYTDTLERLYQIENEIICYIHGKSSNNESEIILGHGTNPSNFDVQEPKPPAGLSDDEMDSRNESILDQTEFSFEQAKLEIHSYYTKSFKNTQIVIENNIDFFNNLNAIENIFVLGHSISSVDIEYFKTVKESSTINAKWQVTYYSEDEKQKHLDTLIELGIKRENIIQLKIEALRKERA